MRHLDISKYIIWIGIIFLTDVSIVQAGWVIFSKPAYEGQVIDAETKEPIEGALVIVYYNKSWLSPAGRIGDTFDAKEILTDKNGKFRFASYITIINPLCVVENTYFTIAKPGYFTIKKYYLHEHFSGINNETKDLYYSNREDNTVQIINVVNNRVMLPRIHNKYERNNRLFGAPLEKFNGEPDWDRFPLSKKIYDEEYNMVKKANDLGWHKERVEKTNIEIADLVKRYNSLYEQWTKDKRWRLHLQFTYDNIKTLIYDHNKSEEFIAIEEGREPIILEISLIRPVPTYQIEEGVNKSGGGIIFNPGNN